MPEQTQPQPKPAALPTPRARVRYAPHIRWNLRALTAKCCVPVSVTWDNAAAETFLSTFEDGALTPTSLVNEARVKQAASS